MSLRRLLFLAGLGVAGAALLRLFAVEGIFVATGSMEPTLPVGTHLFLDKLTIRLASPDRGDIVVFRSPVAPHEDMIKRVIAVGGDRVSMDRKKVFLNGEEVVEPYVQYTRGAERLKGDSFPEETVPDGCLFLLGDNRDESNDASTWRDEEGDPIRFLPASRVRGYVRGFF
jgi:signal peptidase I